MAISPRNLKETNSVAAIQRIISSLNQAKTFAKDSGSVAVVLPAGTPVAFNTSTDQWVPWTNGGSNGTNIIKAIVWPKAVTIDPTSGGEVIGSVMTRGEAHYEDLDITQCTGSAAQLVTTLQEGGDSAGLRSLGIDIKGLDKVI